MSCTKLWARTTETTINIDAMAQMTLTTLTDRNRSFGCNPKRMQARRASTVKLHSCRTINEHPSSLHSVRVSTVVFPRFIESKPTTAMLDISSVRLANLEQNLRTSWSGISAGFPAISSSTREALAASLLGRGEGSGPLRWRKNQIN